MRTITVFQNPAELLDNVKALPPTVKVVLGPSDLSPTFSGDGSAAFACEGFTNGQLIAAGAARLGLTI